MVWYSETFIQLPKEKGTWSDSIQVYLEDGWSLKIEMSDRTESQLENDDYENEHYNCRRLTKEEAINLVDALLKGIDGMKK